MKSAEEILSSRRIIVSSQGDGYIIGQVITPRWKGTIVIGFREDMGDRIV